MSERKTVLWLVSWYPNQYDPFDGDFIQRHARAAALYDDIILLFVKQSTEQTMVTKVEHRQQGLTEWIVYLPKTERWPGKLANIFSWQKNFRKEAALLIKQYKPQLVHVHVPWKAGLVALWIRRKFGIPYLVTEHWGIYNDVVVDNIYRRSLLFRRLLKTIYKEATAIVSVSQFLGGGINKTLLAKNYQVIPNVVDTALFFPTAQKASLFTFLHVSNMVPLKNVTGILQAFQQFLANTNSMAQLVLVGNRDEYYERLAMQLNLPKGSVVFKGELPYSEVAKEMQQAHVLVVNSDMENSPCVIGEALSCGLPVIGTNVGGIPELVNRENSILIPPRDTTALTEAFSSIEKNYWQFDTGKIAVSAQAIFSMTAVGKKLHQLYRG